MIYAYVPDAIVEVFTADVPFASLIDATVCVVLTLEVLICAAVDW